jgi:hypothetical protein
MNDQERQVIDDIFRRLQQVANQPRDPEAERYIADKVRQQPYAPYALAQAVHVQEQAITNLSGEIEQLRAQIDDMQRQPPAQQGGLFSGLFGGGSRAPEPQGPPPGASPWGRPTPQSMQAGGYGMPQQPPMGGPPGAPGPWGGQPRGGGFLQSALTTAAGVAGGVMVANALSHAFGGGEQGSGGLGEAKGLGDFSSGQDSAGDNASTSDISDPLYHDAASEDQDYGGEDFSDGGDGGDWT